MRVQGYADGSFVFIFSAEEKKLGLAILDSIHPYNEESRNNMEIAKDEVRCAGLPKPTSFN